MNYFIFHLYKKLISGIYRFNKAGVWRYDDILFVLVKSLESTIAKLICYKSYIRVINH